MSENATGLLFPGAYSQTSGSKPAIVMAESGEIMTYEELDIYASQLARLYQQYGLKPGDHVAYCVENRLECIALQWGAHYAGLYYTFISNRLTGDEAAYITENCDAKVLILTAKTAPAIFDGIKSLPNAPKILCLDHINYCDQLHDAMAEISRNPLRNTPEGSEMLYSSGTTGKPKGVKPLLSGQTLGSTSIISGMLARGFGVTNESVYLSPAPYYHAAPMKWCQGITTLGGTVVLMEKFDGEHALSLIEKYKVTHSQWVPTMFHRLLALPSSVKAQYNLSSQQVAVHAAAPCPIPTKQAMIDWWGPIIYEYYSCTEAIGMTFTDSATWLSHPGTVGKALLGIPHILDENGNELEANQDGVVYFSDGPRFSYHKDENKTEEAYNTDGWATVGDIGHLDEDGFLYLTDRKSNMIISGGVNVYPQETENVLAVHPSVRDVAVIGIPHEDLGEQVCAYVELEPNTIADDGMRELLIAYCRKHLSPIKCPRKIEFKVALPREPNGKLLKRLLKS